MNFYEKIILFVWKKNGQSMIEITSDEADAMLHFLLDLIYIQRVTGGNAKYYAKKAQQLIIHYGASISSEYGFSQNIPIYESKSLENNKIEYWITLDPMIVVDKIVNNHMIQNGIYSHPYLSEDILNTTFSFDIRIQNTDSLNKIDNLNIINYLPNIRENVQKSLVEIEIMKNKP